MNVNILSPYTPAPISRPVLSRRHAKQRRRSVIFLPTIFLSFLAWAPITEKWMTEKCAQDFGGPDRGIYAASTFAR
jgi:hypothetical protein